MQRLIVSMVRFSTAVTLYGLEQIQTTMYMTQGGQDLSKVMDKFEIALDSLTQALSDKLDQSKKDTLKSVTDIAEEVVNRSTDSMNLMDPREVLKAANDFVQKSTDAVTDWMAKGTPERSDAQPKPAADVLQ